MNYVKVADGLEFSSKSNQNQIISEGVLAKIKEAEVLDWYYLKKKCSSNVKTAMRLFKCRYCFKYFCLAKKWDAPNLILQ